MTEKNMWQRQMLMWCSTHFQGTWAQHSRHMGNSLTSVRSALKKNDTGRVVITARVKGTGKKMKSLLFKGRARGSSDGWQVWSWMFRRSACFTFVWRYCCYYFDLANVSMLCYYHTFQKWCWQELGNELCYIVPEIRTWLNKFCWLTEPSDLSG